MQMGGPLPPHEMALNGKMHGWKHATSCMFKVSFVLLLFLLLTMLFCFIGFKSVTTSPKALRTNTKPSGLNDGLHRLGCRCRVCGFLCSFFSFTNYSYFFCNDIDSQGGEGPFLDIDDHSHSHVIAMQLGTMTTTTNDDTLEDYKRQLTTLLTHHATPPNHPLAPPMPANNSGDQQYHNNIITPPGRTMPALAANASRRAVFFSFFLYF
ncbi:hypothetical protein L208DRAFT_215739 [Tricholoma matsutake]|nr:hypothetical protein L208DRAFT_215739 [Tricholoma matsutake 945]